MNPSEIITPVLDKCKELNEAIPIILGFTATEMIIEQIQIREDQKTEIQKAMNLLSDKIDELESYKRILGIAKRNQNTDLMKLTDYRWRVWREEKDATRS